MDNGNGVRWGPLLLPIMITAAVSGVASFVAQSVIQAQQYGYLDTQVRTNRDSIVELRMEQREMQKFVRETRDIFVIPNTSKIKELETGMISIQRYTEGYVSLPQQVKNLEDGMMELHEEHKGIDVLLYRMTAMESAITDIRTRLELYAQSVRDTKEEIAAVRRAFVAETERDRPEPIRPPSKAPK